jgi:hypothetical protein
VTARTRSGAAVEQSGRALPTWIWALGTALVVVVLVAGAVVSHRAVAGARLAAAYAPPPAVPPAAVTAVLRPESGAAFVAPTGVPGQLALLAEPLEPSCAPTGVCDPPPALDTLLIVDATTGTTVARTPLVGAARQAVALAVDSRRGRAYVISASEVDVFATTNAASAGIFALPAGVTCGPGTGAAVTADGTLLLTARRGDRPALLGIDGASGAVRYADVVAGADQLDGPVYDPDANLAIVLGRQARDATLAVYGAADGAARGAVDVPAGARLGPLDTARRTLYLFEADGATGAIHLADHIGGTGGASVAPVPALYGALALGWNATLGHIYVADDHGLRILDAASGKTLAALPLAVTSVPTAPLPIEETTGALYVPTEHGAVAIVRDAPDPAARALTPDTAALLARAAIARLLPRGGQNPPFITPETFTVGPGDRTLSYWAHDVEFGSDGPYPGTAQLQVAAAASAAGAYDLRFTATWDLRFVHTRVWVYRVERDGAVRLVSDQGDGLP